MSTAPRPLIGLTAGTRQPHDFPCVIGPNRTYVAALQDAGAAVVVLPPGNGVPEALLGVLDGIVLPGGVDVDPVHYHESPDEHLGRVDEELDVLELALARLAVERRLPLFGICRGQQVINVALGGTLHRHLATIIAHRSHPEDGRDYPAHEIEVTPASRLSDALGADRLHVNSHHHQAIKDVALGLVVTAVSPVDGVVEGVESSDGLVLAVQCHPEEMQAHEWARRLFRAFVATAASRRVTA